MKRARLMVNRRGMTLIEVMVAAGLLTLVTAAFVAMLIQSIRGWSSSISGQTSTSNATIGIQRLANDIRDGRSAQVSTDKKTLTVTFPRTITDPGTHEQVYDLSGDGPAPRSYYVSNGSLVRRVGSVTSVLCQGVTTVTFRAWGGTVTVTTLTGSDQEGTHTATQQLTGSIALRNFKS